MKLPPMPGRVGVDAAVTARPTLAPTTAAAPLAGRPSAAPTQARDHLARGGAPVALKPSDFEPLLSLPRLSLALPPEGTVPKAEGVLQGLWKQTVDLFRGSSATREVNRGKKIAGEVNALGPRYAAMSEATLKAETSRFKGEIAAATAPQRDHLEAAELALTAATPSTRAPLAQAVQDARIKLYNAERKVLDKILPEAFAAVREASSRATGMKHYDVQVIGGALMHHGLIAEMYTGEGKTLAATLPAYLNALAGHGYHVATVNDYLAKRDAEEMGAIYNYLGLSVGVLQSNHRQAVLAPGQPAPSEATRQQAYAADITYGTASEFGFDHLRDNQARDPEDRVQRPLYGAILDEVDSLLIDEARIPLILAGKGPAPDLELLGKYDSLAAKIRGDVLDSIHGKPAQPGAVFDKDDIEWEENWVALTDKGQDKLATYLGVDNLYAEATMHEVGYLSDALKAHFLFEESGQYAVVDGKISTVGLSGHLGVGRRFTGGLHQALEMKHSLEVLPENTTSASITMREYLGQYAQWAGMTGTAASARTVFSEVYGLDVARVPTRKPLVRIDYPDKHFRTEAEKTQQFLTDVAKVHATGRPVLIGVEFTHTAERLGELLKAQGLDVQVLGAKSDADEARVIANAGRLGSITVATTRGGRGVDIKLGGNAKVIAEALAEGGLDKAEAKQVAGEQAAKERAAVLGLGGLMVMSYEHLDSRRRDDQLRGRAARQGEPGATLFYTSGEDRLFDDVKRYQEIREGKATWDAGKAPRDTESALDLSENKVNGSLSESLPFDQAVATYRKLYYQARDGVLEASDARPLVEQLVTQALDNVFAGVELSQKGQINSEVEAKALYKGLGAVLALPAGDPPPSWVGRPLADVRKDVDGLVVKLLEKRDASVGGELSRVIEKAQILGVVDTTWGEFLTESQAIRDAIGWRAIAQKDPKLEYKIAVGELYGTTLSVISEQVAARVLKEIPKLPPGLGPTS